MDAAMRRLFSSAFQAANPALIAERRARFFATDEVVFADACSALAALDLRDQVGALAMPILVMREHDEAAPPAMAREVAALLANAKPVELPGCAHVPQLQDPEMFAQVVKGFI